MRLVSAIAVFCATALALPSMAQQKPQPAPLTPRAETQTPVGPPVPTAPQLTRADLEAWLDGFMPYALQRGDVAGAVVVVVKDGQVLMQKGYGYADVDKRTPVDPERTLFRPGSVAKLFTWTAVMQLVERGKLDLDRDVNSYLDFKIPPRDAQPVTLRNIMTHTPGFEEAVKGLMSVDQKGVESLEKVLKRWTPERIYAAGHTPAYSNYATALAGYIVQRVSGQSFDDYIDQNIFTPLGMEYSTFRQPLPDRMKATMSKGYAVASEPEKPYEMVEPVPAGSLAATGADMARFMIAHLQNGGYGSARILRPETVKMMHGTALTMLPPLNRMLLGFYEANINGRQVIAHGGDTQWFHSDLHLYVDDGIGLFVSMNSLGKEGAAGPIRSTLFEQFSDRYLPGPTPDGKVDAKTASDHARLMAGVYDVSRRSESNFLSLLGLLGQAKVLANDDGTITVSLITGLNGQPKKWREISPFVWREVGGEQRVAAKVENGRVARFSFDEVSPFMVFEPTPWWKSSAWLVPLFVAALVAVVLTAVFWPVAAIVRRRYGATFALTGRDARAHRLVRIASVASVVTLAGWAGTVMAMTLNLGLLSPNLDWWFWVLQIVSLVVFIGALLIALWHAWVVWTGTRRWYAKLWSAVLSIACLAVLWVALAFKLIGFSVNY